MSVTGYSNPTVSIYTALLDPTGTGATLKTIAIHGTLATTPIGESKTGTR